MNAPSPLVAIVPALLFVACSDAPAPTPSASSVIDSAGITIVTGGVPLFPAGSWQVGPVKFRIGAVEGDDAEILGEPVGARRLASGLFAIADAMTHQIRLFDDSGRQVSTHGRDGDGPGEYRRLRALAPHLADSLLVAESGARRVSVLAPDLAFGRRVVPQHTFSSRNAGGRPEQSCCRLAGSLGGDLVFEYPGIIPAPGLGERRSTVTVVRLKPDGTFRDTIGQFMSGEYRTAPPGSRVPLMPAALTNTLIAVADVNALYVAEGRNYEVKRFGPDGSLTHSVRLAQPPLPVTVETESRYRFFLDSALQAQLANMPEITQETRHVMEAMDHIQFHATLPAITVLVIDHVGNVWAGAQHSWWDGTDTDVWQVFATDGTWVTTVDLPAGQVVDIGEDYVAVVTRDELDVPFFTAYELSKQD